MLAIAMWKRRGKKTKVDFDLPTEAQWEYTCRAGTTTKFSYGDNADGAYMWRGEEIEGRTHAVGTKKSNPWGFYDMHGNVWEWCLDWHDEALLYGEDPKAVSSGSNRIIRGGSWASPEYTFSSFHRGFGRPSRNAHNFGFRLCAPAQ